jgi:glycosyltransferase involved in cell wall biosynthesis
MSVIGARRHGWQKRPGPVDVAPGRSLKIPARLDSPRVRIALNLLSLVPGETGGSETLARGLVPALAREAGPGALTLMVTAELGAELEAAPWADGVAVRTLAVPGRSRVRRALGEQTLLPLAVRRMRADVLHNLQSTAPVAPSARAMVTTVLDLLYLHHPETHSPLLRRGMAVLVPLAVRRSDRIIAISQATKDDLVRSLGTAAEKIDVVHLGPGLAGAAAPSPEPELRARLGLGEAPILLSPSARRPHKNLERLLDAFARLPGSPVLVAPGYATGAEDALAARAQRLGVGDRVHFTGWLSDADLEGLYECATALVFPSFAEGFGLPVLEAMRHGLPVACADRTSLPEIAGDAALLFDPESTDAIAAAMAALLSDPELRARLARAGRERAGRFSWERAARETLASYERALS